MSRQAAKGEGGLTLGHIGHGYAQALHRRQDCTPPGLLVREQAHRCMQLCAQLQCMSKHGGVLAMQALPFSREAAGCHM